MAEDPQAPVERRLAARHLLQHPLACAEHDPEAFALVRRHEEELDRWFTQRLGFRLQVSTDTARLSKAGASFTVRPLRTSAGRSFHQLEYVLLALTMGSTVAGPAVISLRDLVDIVRSAAADAGVRLADDGTHRRAQVAVLRWMVDHGLAEELHDQVDAYKDDAEADAVLRMRPDRIALLPLPAMVDIADGTELLARADRRPARRAWLRSRLVEEPVLYRHDLTDDEWDELRRRQADEARVLDEMFGLVVEARAEGVATIDPEGDLSAVRFPATGTVHHAALLLIGDLCQRGFIRPADASTGAGWVGWEAVVDTLRALSQPHVRRWRMDLVERPEQLAREVVDLLVSVRLAETAHHRDGRTDLRLLPAAARFRVVEERSGGLPRQATLL